METKVKLDCYLRGVSTANVKPGRLISGIKSGVSVRLRNARTRSPNRPSR
jgi:hypothetical protein